MRRPNVDIIDKKLVEYAKNFEGYEWICKKANNILDNFALNHPDIVYNIKYRIKTAKSLMDKLGKNGHETDIVGLRILYYFREDTPVINEYILEKFICKEIEIYVFPNDANFFEDQFSINEYKQKGIIVQINKDRPLKSGYTGIHYQIFLKGSDLSGEHPSIPVEIQVKSLFEEVWGEIEHDIGYKFPPVNIKRFFKDISEQLVIHHHTMTKIKNCIDEKTIELYDELNKYYSFGEQENVKQKKKILTDFNIIQLLIDLDMEIENAIKSLRILSKLDESYCKILPMEKTDNRLESLEIILTDYELSENIKTKRIKSALGNMVFKKLLIQASNFETYKEILDSFLRDEKNLHDFLGSLLIVLKRKDIIVTDLDGIDIVDNFLIGTWKKKFINKALVFKIVCNMCEYVDIDKWDGLIFEYLNSVQDDKERNYFIQIMERSSKPNNISRQRKQEKILMNLKTMKSKM